MENTIKDNKTFLIVQIENTAFCNRKCSWCPQSHMNFKYNDRMNMETLERIVDDLVEMNYCNRIHPYGNGEPLTDPDFLKKVSYIRKRLPGSFQYISTNGDLVDKTYSFREIWDAGINSIQCNHYDEKNERLRYIPNQSTAIWNGKFYNVSVDHHKIGDLRLTFYNRAGNVKIANISPAQSCWFPGVKLYFNYLGDMLICCADWTFMDVVGNIHDQTLPELLNSPKLDHYRECLAQGKSAELPLCSQCNLIRHQEVL